MMPEEFDLTDRPYRDRKKQELFAEAAGNWDNMQALVMIAMELAKRSRLRVADTAKAADIAQRATALIEQWFRWKQANAAPGQGPPPDGQWPQVGLLKHMGYQVGLNGLEEPQRRQILDAVFGGPVPYVDSPAYMAQWGEPGTPARLAKMASSIASFANNNLRKDVPALAVAIAAWQQDLSYLHQAYYAGRFGFDWPKVAAS